MTLKEDVARARKRWQAAAHELRVLREQLERLDQKIRAERDGTKREEHLREKRAKLTRQKEVLAEVVEHRDKVRDDLVAELKRRQADEKHSINITPGAPHWGGSADVADIFVRPVLKRHGIPETSTKRTETYGNPDSDHHVSQVLAYAIDGGIANAYAVGDEIGEAVGVGTVDDYVSENFVEDGHTYRIQVIAATHGTGPHLHTGIRRVS